MLFGSQHENYMITAFNNMLIDVLTDFSSVGKIEFQQTCVEVTFMCVQVTSNSLISIIFLVYMDGRENVLRLWISSTHNFKLDLYVFMSLWAFKFQRMHSRGFSYFDYVI